MPRSNRASFRAGHSGTVRFHPTSLFLARAAPSNCAALSRPTGSSSADVSRNTCPQGLFRVGVWSDCENQASRSTAQVDGPLGYRLLHASWGIVSSCQWTTGYKGLRKISKVFETDSFRHASSSSRPKSGGLPYCRGAAPLRRYYATWLYPAMPPPRPSGAFAELTSRQILCRAFQLSP